MVVKIDLKKACDRLHWQFIRESLLDVGILIGIVEVVMHCFSSFEFSILWNGEKTKPFKPLRGVGQGDLLM